MLKEFNSKWESINKKNEFSDEASLFVDVGKEPCTQRALNLFYYFKFIKNIFEENSSNKRILEVGCGRGTISLYLSKYLNLDVTLLDSDRNAIEIAKKQFNKYGQKGEFVISNVINIPFDEGSFDAVVSIGLAEHFDILDDIFKEQLRVLKPGGVMISLNIPKKFSIQFLNTVMRFLKKIFGFYKEPITSDYYRNSYSVKEYIHSAENVGFKNISITPVCPFALYTPIKISTDKFITYINKLVLRLRGLFQEYPYKTNLLLAQAHFLVGYKEDKKSEKDGLSSYSNKTGEIYGKLFTDYNEKQFDESVDLFFKRHDLWGMDTSFFKDKICLDAGCGGGRFVVALAKCGAKKAIGVDISRDAITEADYRLDSRDLRNAEVYIGSVLDLKYEDNTFDYVVCSGVIHHTHNPKKGFNELIRVLKPGGTLFLSVYGRGGIKWFINDLFRYSFCKIIPFGVLDFVFSLFGVPANKRYNILDNLYVTYVHRFTEKEIRDWLMPYFDDKDIKRVKFERYDYETLMSRIIHGEGWIQIYAYNKKSYDK